MDDTEGAELAAEVALEAANISHAETHVDADSDGASSDHDDHDDHDPDDPDLAHVHDDDGN